MSIIEGIYLIGVLIYMLVFPVFWIKDFYSKAFSEFMIGVTLSMLTCWFWPVVVFYYGFYKLLKYKKVF